MTKTFKFIMGLFPKRIWAFSNSINEVYLTFDDGPIPEITPWVLEKLAHYNAKATFFCIGDNVEKHPTIFKDVINAGHSIGNHTFYHPNGWKTNTNKYIEDVLICDKEFDKQQLGKTKFSSPKLMRPPYGKIKRRQAKALQKKGYTIVMWSILSKDYNTNISEEKCLQNVLKHIKPGSIIVFHDSLKAANNLKYALPKVLEYCKVKNWKCSSI